MGATEEEGEPTNKPMHSAKSSVFLVDSAFKMEESGHQIYLPNYLACTKVVSKSPIAHLVEIGKV